jgi:hypothetical protein
MSISSRRQELSKDGGINIGIANAPSAIDVSHQKSAEQQHQRSAERDRH